MKELAFASRQGGQRRERGTGAPSRVDAVINQGEFVTLGGPSSPKAGRGSRLGRPSALSARNEVSGYSTDPRARITSLWIIPLG